MEGGVRAITMGPHSAAAALEAGREHTGMPARHGHPGHHADALTHSCASSTTAGAAGGPPARSRPRSPGSVGTVMLAARPGGAHAVPAPVPYDLTSMHAAVKSPDELKRMRRPLREHYREQNDLIMFYDRVMERASAHAAESEAVLKAQAAAALAGGAAGYAPVALYEDDEEAAHSYRRSSVSRGRTTGVSLALPPGAASGGASRAPTAAAAAAAGSGGELPPSSATPPALSPRSMSLGATAADTARTDRLVALAINLSFAANVCLLGLKLYAVASSASLSVIASTVDSVMDLLSGGVVCASAWLASRRNTYLYPIGKSRYEPISIIVFAALMGAASLQLISQGVTALTDGFASGGGHVVADARTYGVLAAIMLIKGALFVFCRSLRKWSTSVGALALDHFADVLTNAGPLAALLLAFYYPSTWWLDPAVAICMSLYMVSMWVLAARVQIRLITGQVATAREIGEITFLALTHSPSIIAVDTVLAYQLGNKLQAEVDVVMDRGTPLEESHDVGESLQRKIEELINVERAFVHIDYEWLNHKKNDEHWDPYAQPSYAPPED